MHTDVAHNLYTAISMSIAKSSLQSFYCNIDKVSFQKEKNSVQADFFFCF